MKSPLDETVVFGDDPVLNVVFTVLPVLPPVMTAGVLVSTVSTVSVVVEPLNELDGLFFSVASLLLLTAGVFDDAVAFDRDFSFFVAVSSPAAVVRALDDETVDADVS